MANKRSPNWSTDELTALVDGIEEHRCQIVGAFSESVTARSKKDAWASVVAKINAVNISGSLRTTQQVTHKWYDLKSTAKRKVCHYKKKSKRTIGGINTATVPSEIDRKVVFIIKEESVDGVSDSKGVSCLSTPLAQHAASPSPSLLITQTESTQVGESPHGNNPLLYQPAPFTAVSSHSVPIADQQLPVESPISHKRRAATPLAQHAASPSLLITQTESTQVGESPHGSNPLLYRPAPFTAVSSHSVPIADQQLPVESPISHKRRAGRKRKANREEITVIQGEIAEDLKRVANSLERLVELAELFVTGK